MYLFLEFFSQRPKGFLKFEWQVVGISKTSSQAAVLIQLVSSGRVFILIFCRCGQKEHISTWSEIQFYKHKNLPRTSPLCYLLQPLRCVATVFPNPEINSKFYAFTKTRSSYPAFDSLSLIFQGSFRA